MKMVQEVRAIAGDVGELQRKMEDAKATVNDLQQDSDDYVQTRDRLMRVLKTMNDKAFQCRTAVLVKEKEIGKLREELEANREEAERLLAGLTDGADQIAALKQEKEELFKTYAVIDEAYKALERQRADCSEIGRETDEKIREARRRQTELSERLHEIDKEKEKIVLQREQSLKKLEEAAEQTVDMAPGALRSRIRSLDRDIVALGPVNPNAVEEYERISGQYEIYQKQIKDVEDAKKNFQQLIQALDADMTKTFRAAFTEIQKAFHDIFIVSVIAEEVVARAFMGASAHGDDGIEQNTEVGSERPWCMCAH